MSGQITDPLMARQFILAGVATVTLVSEKTGTRYTYKINTPMETTEAGGKRRCHGVDEPRFVKVLTGSDNEADYTFLGTIFMPEGRYRTSVKASRMWNVPSTKAWEWAWPYLNVGVIPPHLQVWHEGQCGRCGRKLTVPSSIETGFGPECASHVGL